jgi:hypothetical protein
MKVVATIKTGLAATALIAGLGFAVAQDQVPGNKSEAAAPAPSAQQNAPPDKVAPPDRGSSPSAPPDTKAESKTPALKMDSAPDKKTPGSTGTSRPPP